jgi:hypothetical protein
VAEVVESLVGHAASERAVTDDRDDVALASVSGEFAAMIEGDRETVGVGESGGGVTRFDPVVRAL